MGWLPRWKWIALGCALLALSGIPLTFIGRPGADSEPPIAVVTADDGLAVRVQDRAQIPLTPAPSSGTGVEFNADVRPILEQRCVGCHMEGQIGHPIYSLETAADAVNNASDVARVVETSYMPPWFAGPEMPALEHDPSLTAEEIAVIGAWARAGAPIDGPLDSPLVQSAPIGVSIRADLTLPMPQAYQSPPDRLDDYRCFLLDPALTEQRYITGSEVIPGVVSIVHHVLVFPMPAEARAEAEARSGQDGRPGWECFGGPGLPGVETNTALAPSWVPGAGATVFPDGTGILLQPGDLFVLQVHYNLSAGPQPDTSTLILELSEPGESLIALQGIGLIAPVEIPCPAQYRDTEPCQREHAIRQAEELDPEAGWFSDALLVVCDRSLDQYRDQDAAAVVSSCDQTAPIGGQAIMVNGHLHTLGSSVRITLNPDTDGETVLLDVPQWDFDWQQNYSFVDPVPVEAGDVLRVTCVWDNTEPIVPAPPAPDRAVSPFDRLTGVMTAHAHDTPRTHPYQYVTWGEGTGDEMCLAAVILIPDPEFYGVRLTDMSEEDRAQVETAVTLMRLERLPWSAIAGGVLLAAGGAALLIIWLRRRAGQSPASGRSASAGR